MAVFASRPSADLKFTEILYDKSDMVARITINRQEAYNAYSTNTLQELAAAFTDASFDDSVADTDRCP